MNKIQWACHSNLWPEKDGRRVLDELAEAGFQGVEGMEALRREFAQKTELAHKLLNDRNLRLVGLEYSRQFAHPDLGAEIFRDCGDRIVFLSRMKAPWLILDLGDRETFTSGREDFTLIAGLVNEVAKRSADRGVGTGVRNRIGRRIESEADIDRLLNLVDTDIVSFCPDPAHLVRSGEDPAAIVRTYGRCIRHLYLQDAVLDKNHPEGGYFCEPGEGEVPFPALLKTLKELSYQGWVTARVDAPPKEPGESAERMAAYLRKNFDDPR